MANVRGALVADPLRAIAVFGELASATNSGTRPRSLDGTGKPVDGTVMSRDWFNVQFPKVNGVGRHRTQADPVPYEPPPAQPEPSAQQLVLAARDAFVEAVTSGLMYALADVGQQGGRLVAAAAAAEQTPLPESLADAIELLEKALNVARNDVKDFTVALTRSS